MSERTEIEKQMADIWTRLLGVKAVAADDNFFALGGHSLLGVKLVAAVQEKTGLGDELKLADLFENPTLEAFSAHVGRLAAPSAESGAI
jgi:aryl carrier-like protein